LLLAAAVPFLSSSIISAPELGFITTNGILWVGIASKPDDKPRLIWPSIIPCRCRSKGFLVSIGVVRPIACTHFIG
jgi:hypothetical protein